MLTLAPVIYLAGLMSDEYPDSQVWRLRVTPKLRAAGFEVRTPYRSKRSFPSNDGGITSTLTSKSIVLRDRKDVKESSVVLVHLELFGSPRPLLGTIAELAWCWDSHTPVVAIAGADNYLMHRHPFMAEFISHYETTEEDAVDFVIHYYGPDTA